MNTHAIATARFYADHLTLGAKVHLPGRGQVLEGRQVWFLELSDHAGRRAKGLAAPLAGASAEGADEVSSALEALCGEEGPLLGTSFEDLDAVAALTLRAPWPASVVHALEQALTELVATQHGEPLEHLLGISPLAPPFHTLVRDPWAAQVAMAAGARALKIKVGSDPETLEVVRAIRDAVGPDMRLHLDTNGSWTLEEAISHLKTLEALGVALIEEPITGLDLQAMATLRASTTITIAADESCRSAADLDQIIALAAADAVVLKPMLIGGVSRTKALSERAAEAGLQVIVTHCLDGAMGQRSARLAAGLVPQGAMVTLSAEPGCDPKVLPNPLAVAGKTHPDALALVSPERSLTYGQLAKSASAFARWLKTQGVRPGQRIALRHAPDADMVIALHGVAWLGAIAAPLDPKAQPEESLLERLEVLRPQVLVGDAPPGPWRNLAWPTRLPEGALLAEDWPLEAPRLTLTTSGTTSKARAVTLTGAQLVCSAMGSRARLGHHSGERWLCCLPLHHVGGLAILFRSLFGRTTVELTPRFDPSELADKIASGQITSVSLVPTMLSDLLDQLGDRPPSKALRTVLVGGAALPDALLERARAHGLPIARTWGMTEAGSQVATAAPADWAPGLPPLPLTHVSTRGEVLTISGPLVPGDVFESGDRGRVDALGRVHVHGRRDRVIISGGENLEGGAIEEALREHPKVAEVCVVKQPHPRWGERPGALLVVKEGCKRPRRSELREHFIDRLPSYHFPTRMAWTSALPKTSLGKLSLRRCAERLEGLAEAGWDLERSEALHVDTGVDMAGASLELPGGRSSDLKVQGDGGPPQAPHFDADDELLPEAHGSLEVGLGVDQGHAPALAVEDLSQGIVDGDQERLIGRMTVLEDAPEKSDPSTIDLEEAHGETMFKGHKDSKRRTR